MNKITIFCILIIAFNNTSSVYGDNIWGRLANPGFENQPIKSAFFFTGNWRNGVKFYEHNPTSNTQLFTIHPSDARHLGWSENIANREFAVNVMIDAGVNVITMSFWGPRGTDVWAWWAPMQTSTYSHDELFEICINRDILIAPCIETYAATPNSPGYSFMNCFPGDPDNPAPELTTAIKDLVDRYISNPQNRNWTKKWAQVYDQSGEKRYLFYLLHVASEQEVTDEQFAQGFENVASKIYQDTGVRIGFSLDPMPPNTYAAGKLRPSPEHTGPWLAQQPSVLAIQPYLSDIAIGMTDEDYLIKWKQQFSSKWINSGIPFIQDISPGYDAHIVFPGSVLYGNNPSWRNALSQLIGKLKSQGMSFSAWNGYTEGYAGVPTVEYGDATYYWATNLFKNFKVDGRHVIPGTIEAEDYEQMYGVDKEINTDNGEGFNIGWLDEGDWLDYKVNVVYAGQYNSYIRIAKLSNDVQGEAQLIIDNTTLTTFSVASTGGWQNWETIKTTVNLQAGEQTLCLYIKTGAWNINWMEFKRDVDMKYYDIPGKIEAEYYEDMYGIKTEITFDEGGGFNAGYFDAGDWLDYLIDVKDGGSYDVAFRVALPNDVEKGQAQLFIDNKELCSFSVPHTGGWQTWNTVNEKVNLNSGRQTIRIYVEKGLWNLNWISFSKTPSSVDNMKKASPKAFELYSNYPNPFNQSTTIRFNLHNNSNISLKIFNIQGKEVAILHNGPMVAGEHKIVWKIPLSLPSGLYYCCLKADKYFDVNKAILLK